MERSEEVKTPSLLPPLKEFEVALIVRYIPAREKLLTFALLNKTWHSLIFKHYSWSRLPQPGPMCQLSDFMRFFDSFPALPLVEVPEFPIDFITPHRMGVLEGAKFVGIKDVKGTHKLLKISANHDLLKNLSSLNIEFNGGISA